MTESRFDELLHVFLWRAPEEMSFEEITRAYSIAEHANNAVLWELEQRGEISAEEIEIPQCTPESREIASPLADDDFCLGYANVNVTPLSEDEVSAHMRFVFGGPPFKVDTNALVEIYSAAHGAKARIAVALDRKGLLYSGGDFARAALLSLEPKLLKMAKMSEYPCFPYAIPQSLHIETLLTRS